VPSCIAVLVDLSPFELSLADVWVRLVVALDIADSPAGGHQVGNASPSHSGKDLNGASGCRSPQSVRKNFSRDPSRLMMLNDAPITFVQVRAAF